MTKELTSKTVIASVFVALGVFGAANVEAAGGGPPEVSEPVDADFAAGRRAVKAKKWEAAIERLQRAAQRNPRDAETHNLLGYAYRHVNQLDNSFKHYNEALQLDPNHKGVHEYIGQAYLLRGDRAKAQEHLATLQKLCGVNCEEYRDLKQAIDQAEKK